MKLLKQSMVWLLCCALFISTSASAAGPQSSSSQGQAQDANLTPQELDNLLAPIALYPDSLVAQILAAATYPDQITAANNWLKANSNLKDQALVQAVDKQSWDPGVKALTQFPSVLDNMAKNLSWTSALGEASYYQQKDVMASIQRLRKEAKAAGNLKSGEQIKVVQQDPQTIVIQPANPQVVYVPVYSPTVVYGVPYYPPGYTSAVAATAVISFGVGLAIGAAMHNSWGYGGWGCGWHGGTVVYNRNVYVSRSAVYGGGYARGSYGGAYGGNRATAYNRSNVNTGNVNRGNVNTGNVNSGNRTVNKGGNTVNINTGGNTTNNANRQSASTRSATGTSGTSSGTADRGYGQRSSGGSSGALGEYNKGGNARTDASRGSSSFSGGGGTSRGSGGASRSGSGRGGSR